MEKIIKKFINEKLKNKIGSEKIISFEIDEDCLYINTKNSCYDYSTTTVLRWVSKKLNDITDGNYMNPSINRFKERLINEFFDDNDKIKQIKSTKK